MPEWIVVYLAYIMQPFYLPASDKVVNATKYGALSQKHLYKTGHQNFTVKIKLLIYLYLMLIRLSSFIRLTCLVSFLKPVLHKVGCTCF